MHRMSEKSKWVIEKSDFDCLLGFFNVISIFSDVCNKVMSQKIVSHLAPDRHKKNVLTKQSSSLIQEH